MDLNFVCFSCFKQVLSGIHAVLNKLISVLILSSVKNNWYSGPIKTTREDDNFLLFRVLRYCSFV